MTVFVLIFCVTCVRRVTHTWITSLSTVRLSVIPVLCCHTFFCHSVAFSVSLSHFFLSVTLSVTACFSRWLVCSLEYSCLMVVCKCASGFLNFFCLFLRQCFIVVLSADYNSSRKTWNSFLYVSKVVSVLYYVNMYIYLSLLNAKCVHFFKKKVKTHGYTCR